MNSKFLILITALFLLCGPSFGVVNAKDAVKLPKISITQERADKTYHVGDKVVFTIKLVYEDGSAVKDKLPVSIHMTRDGGARLSRSLTRGGEKINGSQAPEIDSTPVQVEHTLAEPGFIRLSVIGRSWQGKREFISARAIAGCDPESIQPAVTMPADFEEFWQQGRAELAKLPLDYQQKREDTLSNEKHDVYQISFANINNTRIHGYLLIPKSGKAKYPAMVTVASAGIGKPKARDVIRQIIITDDQAIGLIMGVYDHELGKPKSFYKKLEIQGGSVSNAFRQPKDYFFYRAALGIDRAINWLATREDVDTKHVVYYGVSQGGGMGLLLTGLNKNIIACTVANPGLCDHVAYLAGREPGWPGILTHYNLRKFSDEQTQRASTTLAYFDAVNFARHITVPVLISMGYMDGTCPPSGVYSAYNVIKSPKSILVDPNAGHEGAATAGQVMGDWARKYMGIKGDEN